MSDPTGTTSILDTIKSISGLQKLENSITQGCSIGSIASSGGMVVLNIGSLIPGVGEGDLEGQIAVRGLVKAAEAESLATKAANISFKTMHVTSHLDDIGLPSNIIESAIKRNLMSNLSLLRAEASITIPLRIGNIDIEYRAILRPDGINVGTYYLAK